MAMNIWDVSQARENYRRYEWAQTIVQSWRQETAYGLSRERPFFEEMISELTPWSEYGQNCPACVGVMSSMGECGIYTWEVEQPDRLVCSCCGTEYPNDKYPETGRVVASRMGQEFSFYLTEEERAHPEDRSGRHAFKWVSFPVHSSWSGVLRSKKARWCYEQMGLMAKIYAITEEVEYAERAAWILDIFARRYPGWLFHSYDGTIADVAPAAAAAELGRHPRGGRFAPQDIVSAFAGRHQEGDHGVLFNGFWGAGRFGCSGSDGQMLLNALRSRQLVLAARLSDGTPVLTEAMDRRICRDLVLAGCTDTEHWDEINNKCGPGRALSGAVGIVFERAASLRRAIEGLEQLLEKAFHFDGFCTESPSYSGMHLNLMQPIFEVLSAYGGQGDFDVFERCDRYRLGLESMVRMLDPRLQYPVIGDTHAGSGLEPIYAEILAAHYGDSYGALLEKVQDARLQDLGREYALWYRDPDLAVGGQAELPLYTEWFPGWHVGVLRGRETKVHTAFYFNGYAHGGHRHYDTLGIIYIAHREEMAADRGYIWDDPRNAWTKSTLAHNIVTVDGQNQNGAQCQSTLELFGRGPGVEVVQARANAYEQCDQYRRLCALIEVPGGQSYAVDFFRVNGGALHQYGFHCNGELVGLEGVELAPADDQIEWVGNVRAAQPEAEVKASWENRGVLLDLYLLSPFDRLLLVDAPGWRNDSGQQLKAPPVQQVLAERQGKGASRYAAVMAPYEIGPAPVQGARLVVDDPASGLMGVAVERDGCTDYVLSAPGGNDFQCGPVSFNGAFAFVSVDATGQVLRAYLLGGTKLSCGDLALELEAARTVLEVVGVEGSTFLLAQEMPVGCVLDGAWVLAGGTGFAIESVAPKAITVRSYPAVETDKIQLLHGVSWGTDN